MVVMGNLSMIGVDAVAAQAEMLPGLSAREPSGVEAGEHSDFDQVLRQVGCGTVPGAGSGTEGQPAQEACGRPEIPGLAPFADNASPDAEATPPEPAVQKVAALLRALGRVLAQAPVSPSRPESLPAQLAHAESETPDPLAFLSAGQADTPMAHPVIEVLDADPTGEIPLSAGALSTDAIKELTIELEAAIRALESVGGMSVPLLAQEEPSAAAGIDPQSDLPAAGDGSDAHTEPVGAQEETQSAQDAALSLAGLLTVLMRRVMTAPSVAAVPPGEEAAGTVVDAHSTKAEVAALLTGLSRLVKVLPGMPATPHGDRTEPQVVEGAAASPGPQTPALVGDDKPALSAEAPVPAAFRLPQPGEPRSEAGQSRTNGFQQSVQPGHPEVARTGQDASGTGPEPAFREEWKPIDSAVAPTRLQSLEPEAAALLNSEGRGARREAQIATQQAPIPSPQIVDPERVVTPGVSQPRGLERGLPVNEATPTVAVQDLPPDPAAPQTIPSVRLEVDRPEVGRVRLHVSLSGDTVYANVVTEQPAVRDFLLQQQGRLQAGLSAYGLDVGGFQVAVDQQGQGRSDSGSRFMPGPGLAAHQDPPPDSGGSSQPGQGDDRASDAGWSERALSLFA